MNIDLMLALGLLGGFVAIIMVVTFINYSVVEPMRKRRVIQQRIRSSKKGKDFRTQIFKAYQESSQGPVIAIIHRLTGWSKAESLQRQLLQGDIYISPGVFICVVGISGALGFLVSSKLQLGFWDPIIGLAAGYVPFMLLHWKQKRKTAKFEKYMPDAMELLARSLRAGHTLPSTLELVSQEIPAPLGKEMRITYEEQRLGLSVSQALRRMSERVASQDLRFFVTAVLIQSETGGNLAEILENIGSLIRDRLKLKGKVDALTAEGRLSAIILIALPMLVFSALYFLNRPYALILLTDPLGIKILTGGIASIVFGALVMKRMITIKV